MAVARLWADRLEDGKKLNFAEVPPRLQDKVRTLLEQDGYEILPSGRVVPVNGGE